MRNFHVNWSYGLMILILNTQPTFCDCTNKCKTNCSLSRVKRQFDTPPAFFAPAGVSDENEARAPLKIELLHNLTTQNGPLGRCGICWRRYRVLYDLRHRPSEECRRYSNSRQAALGDLTEFYHTLYKKSNPEKTITVLLADTFPDLSLSASFMVPPHLMIEAATQATQTLCVESIRCPDSFTTIAPPPLNANNRVETAVLSSDKKYPVDELLKIASTEKTPLNFWEAIIATSSPRSWVIATLSLGALSFLLFLALIISCVWVCNIKRHLKRKRCRGTCKFGCKCSSDLIRQAAGDTTISAGSLHNGSVIGYPNSVRSVYSGANGKTQLTPLYMPIGNNDRFSSPQESVAPIPENMMLQGSNAGSGTGTVLNWPNYQFSTRKENRFSQDPAWCGQSDGSSISEHTGQSYHGSKQRGHRSQKSKSSGPPAGLSSATASTCLPSYNRADGDSVKALGNNLFHSSSPGRFDDMNRDQLSMSASGIREENLQSPTDFRGLDRDGFNEQRGVRDVTHITPPVGFFDQKSVISTPVGNQGSFESRSSSSPPWESGIDSKCYTKSTFNGIGFNRIPSTSSYHCQPPGGVKVLPTGDPITNKCNQVSDYAYRNGYVGSDTLNEFNSRTSAGLVTRHSLNHLKDNNSFEKLNSTLRPLAEGLAP